MSPKEKYVRRRRFSCMFACPSRWLNYPSLGRKAETASISTVCLSFVHKSVPCVILNCFLIGWEKGRRGRARESRLDMLRHWVEGGFFGIFQSL